GAHEGYDLSAASVGVAIRNKTPVRKKTPLYRRRFAVSAGERPSSAARASEGLYCRRANTATPRRSISPTSIPERDDCRIDARLESPMEFASHNRRRLLPRLLVQRQRIKRATGSVPKFARVHGCRCWLAQQC